jgi:hypothetical protein
MSDNDIINNCILCIDKKILIIFSIIFLVLIILYFIFAAIFKFWPWSKTYNCKEGKCVKFKKNEEDLDEEGNIKTKGTYKNKKDCEDKCNIGSLKRYDCNIYTKTCFENDTGKYTNMDDCIKECDNDIIYSCNIKELVQGDENYTEPKGNEPTEEEIEANKIYTCVITSPENPGETYNTPEDCFKECKSNNQSNKNIEYGCYNDKCILCGYNNGIDCESNLVNSTFITYDMCMTNPQCNNDKIA